MSAYHDYKFKLQGIIEFDPVEVTKKQEKQSSWKKVALVMIDCPDFWKYYSWFVKKRYNLELVTPIRGAHFTVINDRVSDLKQYEYCKSIYNGSIVNFEYAIDLRTDDVSWWVGVKSEDAEKIRTTCGLPPKPFWGFHITIGRADGDLRLQHSKYIHSLIKTYGGEYL